MGFMTELAKALKATKAGAKPGKAAAVKAPDKKKAAATTKGAASPKSKTAGAKQRDGRSAIIEAKYPGGKWLTMNGHHIYVKGDGAIAPETLPSDAAAKARILAKHVGPKLAAGKKPAAKLQKETKQATAEVAAAKKKTERIIKKQRAASKVAGDMSANTYTSTRWKNDPKTGAVEQVAVKAGNTITPKAKPVSPKLSAAQDAADTNIVASASDVKKHRVSDKVRALMGDEFAEDREHAGDFYVPKLEEVAEGKKRLARNEDGSIQFESIKGKMKEGDFVERYEGLTRYYAKSFLRKKGLNHIGVAGDNNSGVKTQASPNTGYFDDLAQEFRVGLMSGLREFMDAKAAGRSLEGANPSQFAVHRAIDRMSRYGHGLMENIQLPRTLRTPLAAYGQAVKDAQQAHETNSPTPAQVLEHLEGTSAWEAFQPFVPGKKGEYITDPHEKLKVLELLNNRNRKVSLQNVVAGGGGSGDKGITGEGVFKDENQDTEGAAVHKQHQKEANNAIHELFNNAGLAEREMKVIQYQFGLRSGQSLTEEVDLGKVADALGISHANARQIKTRAMAKIKDYVQANPEMATRLRGFLKSFDKVGAMLMKSLFEADLFDLLDAYGVGPDLLEWSMTRQVTVKSLDLLHVGTTEYVINKSFIHGQGVYQVTFGEPVLPADSILIKALEAAGDILSKSATGGEHRTHSAAERVAINQKVRTWLNGAGRQRFESHVKTQSEAIAQKQGALTWSEQLLADNPGSAWITWGGHKILIRGDGRIMYDSKAGRDSGGAGYDPESQKHVAVDEEGNETAHDLHDGTEDYSLEQKAAEVDEKAKGKALQLDADEMKQRFLAHREQFQQTDDFKEMKQRMGGDAKRYLAPGKYMATGPDGKRAVFEIKMTEGRNKKGDTVMTPGLGDVWSVDEDEGKGVSKHESNYGVLLGLLYGVKGGQQAYDKVHGTTGGKSGLMLPETLEKWAYGKDYAGREDTHKLTKLEDNEWDSILSKTDNAAGELQLKKTTAALAKSEKQVEAHAGGGHTYKINLPDGRNATFNVGRDGQLEDPVMRQLLNVGEDGIRPGDAGLFDIEMAVARSVGRKSWVTVSPSSWRTGKGAHHHIQLEYTGIESPPKVVGGEWDGRLYADAKDLTDPEQKKLALFKNGKLAEGSVKTTAYRKAPHEAGDKMRFRAHGRSRYQSGTVERVIKNNFNGETLGWEVRVPGQEKTVRVTTDQFQIEANRKKDVIAGSLPVADWHKDHLSVTVPENLKSIFEDDLKISVKDGKADMSLAQFAQVREAFGGFTLTDKAAPKVNQYLEDQDKPPGFMDKEERQATYQPSEVAGKKGEALRALFKDSSKKLHDQPFYDTQLEGVHHLLTAKRGVAGHGMGTGKTQLGMLAIAHQIADAHAAGVKSKKKLIVSPAAIVSDWLKEFKGHTNIKMAVMGGHGMGNKDKATGQRMIGTMDGENDLRAPVVQYEKGEKIDFDSIDADVVVVSHDFFSKNSHLFNQGHFDTMAIDEVHNLKNPEGSRGGALQAIAQAGHMKNIWGLSGTPMENDPTELWNLINMSTAGQHNLGSKDEFVQNFFERKGGKVVRVQPHKMEELGKVLAKYVQFRKGEDVGVEFPSITRPADGYESNPYHGSKVGVHHNYTEKYVKLDKNGKATDAAPDDPDAYRLFNPDLNMMGEKDKAFYERYHKLEQTLLPQNELAKLRGAAATGYDNSKDDKGEGYLSSVNKLQQFMNAPDAWEVLNRDFLHRKEAEQAAKAAHAEGIDATPDEFMKMSAQDMDASAAAKVTMKNGYHGVMDGKTFVPLHQNSPMASWIGDRIRNHLNAQQTMNANRRAQGKKEVPPKIVLSSQFTQLGTRMLENVVNDLKHEYPELSHATYTGESGPERDQYATSFNKADGVNVMIMSSAAKEGKDFGTGQLFLSLDHEWNPQRTAQKVARTRRSDSKRKRAELAGEDPNSDMARDLNKVSVEAPFIPGTIHGDILNAHDRKIANIESVVNATRKAEGFVPNKPGETAGQVGAMAGEHKRFGAKPGKARDPVADAKRKHDSLVQRAQELRSNAENTKTATIATRQGQKVSEKSDKLAGAARKNLLREAAKMDAQAARLRDKHGFESDQGALAVNKGFTFDFRPKPRLQHVILLGRANHG